MNGQAKMQMQSESAQDAKVPTGIGSGKRCTKCGTVKPVSEFHRHKKAKDGYNWKCKLCQGEYAQKWYTANAKKIKGSARKWRLANKEKAKEYARKYRVAKRKKLNKADREWRLANPEKVREYNRMWRAVNPEKKREYCRKMRLTSKGKLNNAMARGIWESLKSGSKAGRHWETLVDFTVGDLKKHLEKQFTKEMTWENHGSFWHIDHVTPISAFNYETPEHIDFKRCWALKNLRPLEAKENMRKGAKIDRPFQPSLAIAL